MAKTIEALPVPKLEHTLVEVPAGVLDPRDPRYIDPELEIGRPGIMPEGVDVIPAVDMRASGILGKDAPDTTPPTRRHYALRTPYRLLLVEAMCWILFGCHSLRAVKPAGQCLP